MPKARAFQGPAHTAFIVWYVPVLVGSGSDGSFLYMENRAI